MLGGGMTDGGIGVGASPGQNRSAIDDEVAYPDQPTPDGGQHTEDEERLGHRRSSSLSTLALLGGLLMRGCPSRPTGKPQARASASQATNQLCIFW